MKNKSSQLTADSALDANGFVTLRRSDGTTHGNTDVKPIATVYTSEDAARIVAAVNAFPALLAALEQIAGMTCDGTGRTFDEWGEAACFTDCKGIARDCLASVKGRAP